MKLAVFGGAGFIGSTVCDALLSEGYALRIFERPRVTPYREFTALEQVEWFTGDLLSTSDVRTVLDGTDAVIHLVSTTLPKGSNEDPIYDVSTNVVGTLIMLDQMKLLGLRKIIFISSGGTVYGASDEGEISEDHPTNPIVSYGITKLTIEKYIQLYNRIHNFNGIILRVSNPYGERQRVETAQGAVAVFLSKVMHGEEIEIWGDGSVVRDYVYVRDVADAFVAAMKYDGSVSVFNIGSGVGTTINELLHDISIVTEVAPNVKYLSGRRFDVARNVLSVRLANQQLRWHPRINLRAGLFNTYQWLCKKGTGK